jgi:hypothetical protein
MSAQPYDSTSDTLTHIRRVNHLLLLCCIDLQCRAQEHDSSKLIEPEKSAFDALVPRLKDFKYGSDEYRACLREMKPALTHHYASNRHHPEHFEYGVDNMSLLDVLEMLIDWKAASERMQDGGSILSSIKHNVGRFGLSPQVAHLLINTAVALHWCDAEEANKLFWEIGGVPPKESK